MFSGTATESVVERNVAYQNFGKGVHGDNELHA